MHFLNYQHLRYFWAVAREGNLTRAAQDLHVTQSAVSVQLKKLEAAVGLPLFERRGRGLQLTHAGRLALDYAESIFAMGDELLTVLREADHDARRTLRVGVLATLSRNFQIAFLRPLMNRQDTAVTVHSGTAGDLVQRLEEHRLDVVLTDYAPARGADATWVAHVIDEQPVSLVGHPKKKWPRSLAKLLGHEPLVVPAKDSGIRAGFDALVEQLGVTPSIVAEVDDMAMLRLMTIEHDGLAVVPPIVVHDELESGRLCEVLRLPNLAETFIALTTPRRLRSPLLDELLQRQRKSRQSHGPKRRP
jgi:LysR family transcriptional activator of nhaA